MTLKFVETEIPSMERPKAPNPFAEIVTAIVNKNKAATTHYPVDVADGPDDKDPTGRTIGRVRRLLTEAGEPFEVTVRTQIVPSADGKTLEVTLWTIPKIRRTKGEVEDDSAEAVAA